MRKILLTIAILIVYNNVFATIFTCSNANPNPGTYDFYWAMNTANVDDTIYVSGSVFSYGNATIDKDVVIIGTGHNPQKQNPLKSHFDRLLITTNGSGARLENLEVDVIITHPNLFFKAYACKIATLRLTNTNVNPTLSACVVTDSIYFSDPVSTLKVYNSLLCCPIEVYNLDGNDYLYNNVFIGTGNFIKCNNTNDGNAIIRNNIFYGKVPNITGGTLTGTGIGSFTHNVSYLNSFPDDDGNNIVGNPLFNNVPIGTASFNPTHDYHLQASSPALTPGDGASERGLFAAVYGYRIFRPTGEASIPLIKTMSITPTTVLSGQSIQVNFSSKVNP